MGLFDFLRPKPPAQSAARTVNFDTDSEGMDVDVVGESFNQDNLERIAGPKTPDGPTRSSFEAALVLYRSNPHDPEAIRVEINGLTVGHLSREDARTVRAATGGTGQEGSIEGVLAKVTGGWARSRSDTGTYGVVLTLPSKWFGIAPRPKPAPLELQPVQPPAGAVVAIEIIGESQHQDELKRLTALADGQLLAAVLRPVDGSVLALVNGLVVGELGKSMASKFNAEFSAEIDGIQAQIRPGERTTGGFFKPSGVTLYVPIDVVVRLK